ncbi:MAG: ABC transporter ATP-binding protein [Bacteroidetes bacterium]|nr:ABC transporter ATP-binding protein [Bacteroidota bacterium]
MKQAIAHGSGDQIISVRNLSKSYGSFKAVDQLNLDVFYGDVFGFLGPNGAGKSTTIRMLLSLIKPSEGSIKIFGQDLNQHRNTILGKIGCIVEKPDFYKYLSAEKNLHYFAALSGFSASKSKIYEMLELVGLKGREKDKIKGYSHGMKQRLGIAQTLIHNPDLIVLDEPTTGLDPQGIIDIRNLILHLQRDLNKTVFLSSHILSEIELIASRMVIINKGREIVQGEVGTLLNSEELIVSFDFLSSSNARSCLEESQWVQYFIEQKEDKLIFHLSEFQISELNNYFCERKVGVKAIESKRKLEDYFLKLTSN